MEIAEVVQVEPQLGPECEARHHVTRPGFMTIFTGPNLPSSIDLLEANWEGCKF